MIKTVFGGLWRAFKWAFTLKGILISSLVGLLAAAIVFAIPQRLREPRYRPPVESTETASSESTANPRMAIVLSGLGGEGRGVESLVARLLALQVPLTYGVTPASVNSKRHAQLVSGSQGEIAMNLPLVFSKGRNRQVAGDVEFNMRRRQIGRQVVSDIFTVGSVAGIEARGGYATGKTDSAMMRIVMAMAKRRNLYFLDISSNAAAKRLAGEIDLQYFAPDVVLDEPAKADHIERQMSVAINKAVSDHANIVVLAHVLPVTVNLLPGLVGKVKQANIELTTLSALNASPEATVTPSLVPTSTGEESPTAPTSTVQPPGAGEIPGGARPY